ncbi:hypothetical protein [Morganella morganii]|uniref:hypothetical protein n=1 Tax=Morganella morganii TaxID=582 RepID=UPI00324692FB
MTAIVFPHVYCNDGIITDLSGYGCIPGNLGLPELLDKKFDKTGGKITGQTDIEAPGGRTQTLKAKTALLQIVGGDKLIIPFC